MTIVNAVSIRPRSGEDWDELQKQLKKAIVIVKKHGGENVTLLVTVIGGEQTNALTMLVTSENWTRFGQIQEAVYGDPKMQALMRETGKIATWEIYTAQQRPGRGLARRRRPAARHRRQRRPGHRAGHRGAGAQPGRPRNRGRAQGCWTRSRPAAAVDARHHAGVRRQHRLDRGPAVDAAPSMLVLNRKG